MTSYKEEVTIVYYVLGAQKYYDECLICLQNIREHEPTIKIVVYADRHWDRFTDYDAEVRVRDWKPGWLSKIRTLADMQEDRILYLDTDTYLTAPLEPMMRLCEPYGFAAAPDPIVDTRYFQQVDMPWLDEELAPELNCGVIYVSKSRLPAGFLDRWIAIHHELAKASDRELEFLPDQSSLRRLLHDIRIPYGILPNLYNFRACYPQTLGEPPLLIHSRTPVPHRVASRLAKVKDVTVWFPFMVTIPRIGLAHKAVYFLFRQAERLMSSGAPAAAQKRT